jgi:hypothetical protein
MDFEWIKGVICWAKQTWKGWLSLRWFWTKTLSTQTESWRVACFPKKSIGGAYIGEAGRPGLTGLGCLWPSLARFPPAWSSPFCDFCACVLNKLHRPNSLIHSFACIIGPSTGCLCFESYPCSFASHASMNFLQNKAWCPPILALCMWPWWKLLEEHPVMEHGACMICLTRLPPS